jgi:hypothetical protein
VWAPLGASLSGFLFRGFWWFLVKKYFGVWTKSGPFWMPFYVDMMGVGGVFDLEVFESLDLGDFLRVLRGFRFRCQKRKAFKV